MCACAGRGTTAALAMQPTLGSLDVPLPSPIPPKQAGHTHKNAETWGPFHTRARDGLGVSHPLGARMGQHQRRADGEGSRRIPTHSDSGCVREGVTLCLKAAGSP